MIELTRIPIITRPQGFYMRWFYNGWHYWQFYPGKYLYDTRGEKYRTYGTRSITISSGSISEAQAEAIRSIMNTPEVYLYTDGGWMYTKIDPGTVQIKNNYVDGYEIELTALIGSRLISTTGFSPVVLIPDGGNPDLCEVIVGTQIWMCRNWDSAFPQSKIYDDLVINKNTYGGLYNFDQVMASGFCPPGWHVPTLADANTLIDNLGGDSVAGGHLKSSGTLYWDSPNTGADNSSGLDFRGGGCFSTDFNSLKSVGKYWLKDPSNPNNKYFLKLSKDSAAVEIVSANLNGSVQTIQSNVPGVTPIARVDEIYLIDGNCGAADITCQNLTKRMYFAADFANTTHLFVLTYYDDYAAIGVLLSSNGRRLYFTAATAGVDFSYTTSFVSVGVAISGTVTRPYVPNSVGHAAIARVDRITLQGTYGMVSITCEGVTRDIEFQGDLAETAQTFVDLYYNIYRTNSVIISRIGINLYFTARYAAYDFTENNTGIVTIDGDLHEHVSAPFVAHEDAVSAVKRRDRIVIDPNSTTGTLDIRCQGVTQTLTFNTSVNQSVAQFVADFAADFAAEGGGVVLSCSFNIIYFTAPVAGTDFVYNDTAVSGYNVLLTGSAINNFTPNRPAVIAVARIDRLTIDPTCEGGSAEIFCTSRGKRINFNTSVNQTVIDFYNLYNAFYDARNAVMSYLDNVIDFTAKIAGIDSLIDTQINTIYGESNDYFSLRLIKDIAAPQGVYDIDGNVYTYVTIGTQQWLVENLKTTKYADGTPIPHLSLNADWIAEDGSVGHDGAYCWYNNNIANKAVYGAYYNWYAVVNAHKLAEGQFTENGLPSIGWRVADNVDWALLATYLGGSTIAGGKLKEIGTIHWTYPNTGATDEFGWRGLPSGERQADSGDQGNFGEFWSPDAFIGTYAYGWILTYNDVTLSFNSNEEKHFGFAVRCVRDI